MPTACGCRLLTRMETKLHGKHLKLLVYGVTAALCMAALAALVRVNYRHLIVTTAFKINALLDFTPPRIYHIPVIGKTQRVRNQSGYFLRVGPWGPLTKRGWLKVTADQYYVTPIGDQEVLCGYVGKGALNIAWLRVRPCPKGVASAAQSQPHGAGSPEGGAAVGSRPEIVPQ